MSQTLWGETKTRRRRRINHTSSAKAPYSITGWNDCEILGHTLSHWSLAGTNACMDCGAKIFCLSCIPGHPNDAKAIPVLCTLHEQESEARHAV